MYKMVSIKKLLVLSFIIFFTSVGSVLAQSPSPSSVPSPEPGHNQSEFAKDVEEGEQSIKNDNDAQKNQKEINENEIDEGQQEDEDIDIDEEIDQDEAQEDQEDVEVKLEEDTEGHEGEKDSNIQNEEDNGQEHNITSPTSSPI